MFNVMYNITCQESTLQVGYIKLYDYDVKHACSWAIPVHSTVTDMTNRICYLQKTVPAAWCI